MSVDSAPSGQVTHFGSDCGHKGLETLIHSVQTADGHRDIVREVGASSKEAVETKFSSVVASKENDIRAERLERENQNKLDDVRREILNAVKEEGLATRLMTQNIENSRKDALIVQLQAQLLKLTP